MVQFFPGVYFQLLGDAHVLGALQHLRVHDVGDDRLVLAGEILVQAVDELGSRDLRLCHGSSPAGLCQSRAGQEWCPMLLRAGLASVWTILLLVPARAGAQVFTLTKDQLIELSAQNPYERFPDGRPKVPDAPDRPRARPVGRRHPDGAARQGLSQPVRGRLPHPASGHQAGRPGVHGAVHARASGRRRRVERQGVEGGPAAPVEPVRDRPVAAGRRAGGGPVWQARGRHDRRRQPVLLRDEGHRRRRPRRGRLRARSRGPVADPDAGVFPSGAPDRDQPGDDLGHQRPRAHRQESP